MSEPVQVIAHKAHVDVTLPAEHDPRFSTIIVRSHRDGPTRVYDVAGHRIALIESGEYAVFDSSPTWLSRLMFWREPAARWSKR